jgi:hypothetical protein
MHGGLIKVVVIFQISTLLSPRPAIPADADHAGTIDLLEDTRGACKPVTKTSTPADARLAE